MENMSWNWHYFDSINNWEVVWETNLFYRQADWPFDGTNPYKPWQNIESPAMALEQNFTMK